MVKKSENVKVIETKMETRQTRKTPSRTPRGFRPASEKVRSSCHITSSFDYLVDTGVELAVKIFVQ